MTVWRYSISWSKLDLALRCPLALQKTIDKAPGARYQPTFWMDSGTLVQKTFEVFFNQRINLKPGGDRPEVIQRATNKVLTSQFRKELGTTFPEGKSDTDLDIMVREHTAKGLEHLREIGLLIRDVRSEVKWNSIFRGMRTFAMIDFLTEGPDGIEIYDGKGHQKEDANPDQLRYYALTIASSGRKMAKGGLIYWQHGYREVDLSPPAIKLFADTTIQKVQPLFRQLADGVEKLEATPSEKACGRCLWSQTCLSSAVRRPDVTNPITEEVGLNMV